MNTRVPAEAQERIDEFWKQEKKKQKPADVTGKRVRLLKKNLNHLFRPPELVQLAINAGFTVISGGDHKKVYDGRHLVTEIPHSTGAEDTLNKFISNNVIQKLIKRLNGK